MIDVRWTDAQADDLRACTAAPPLRPASRSETAEHNERGSCLAQRSCASGARLRGQTAQPAVSGGKARENNRERIRARAYSRGVSSRQALRSKFRSWPTRAAAA